MMHSSGNKHDITPAQSGLMRSGMAIGNCSDSLLSENRW